MAGKARPLEQQVTCLQSTAESYRWPAARTYRFAPLGVAPQAGPSDQ